MINILREPTAGIAFAANQQNNDLARGVFLEKLEITIDGTVDIAAGGGADGTVVADGIARLIRNLIIKWDNEQIANVTGRDLLLLTKMCSNVAVADTQLAAASVGTEAFSLTLILPFARPWLVNPFETVLPPLDIRNQFKVLVDWAQDVNAGSVVPGTGVLVDGGTRVITFTVPPTITITQYGALRGKMPWYLPYYSNFDSDTFAQANARLRFLLGAGGSNTRRFDSLVISPRNGTLQVDADILNTFSMSMQGANFFNVVRAKDLRANLRQTFPAFAGDLNFPLKIADGGWLGNVAEPGNMVSPLLQFDVAAPSGTGLVHLLFSELATDPRYTQVKA